MGAYAFCLEPEKRLYEIVSSIKKEILAKYGSSLYLEDPPHITLYVGRFKDKFLEESKYLTNLVKENHGICISVEVTFIFGPDPITGMDTPIYLVKSTPELRRLQEETIHFLEKHREKGIVKRYSTIKFEKSFQNNLDKYGYPFVGSVWKPHISLGSFNKNCVDLNKIKWEDKVKPGNYKIKELVIYSLDEDSEKLTEIKRIPFEND